MFTPMIKTHRRSAFTLIELLVVIAIIAILAAILFPVFAQAKDAAKKTQSLSNIKNLATGVMIYLPDYDDTIPMSEYDAGANYVSWATEIMPYVKNGDTMVTSSGRTITIGSDGIFRSPGVPAPGVRQRNNKEFSYGVHFSLFVTNYYESWAGYPGVTGNLNPGVNYNVVDAPADKIMMMEKGINDSGNQWNYPWFHDWQAMWVDSICTVSGDPSTVYRDGVDIYTPGTGVYTPYFDNDCPTTWGGGWECAASARYRFTRVSPMAFMDGHAKGMKKGEIKWFKNIWVDRRNLNRYSWYYDYQNGGGWGFPGIH